MKTTSLFVEIMIVGCETLMWVVLLLMCVFDFSHQRAEEILGNRLIWVPAFAFCYVLGIVMDSRIHEVFFRSRQKAIRADVIRKGEKNSELTDDECKERWKEIRKAALVMPASAGGISSLDYIRHRIRIMRGSVGNIPLIASLGSLLLIKSECHLAYTGVALLTGGLLCYACCRVWKRIEKSWSTLSYDWYVIYNSQQKQGQP